MLAELALPLTNGTGEPKSTPSILNCTVPVAELGDTVAVKYTPWPKTDGFTDDVNVVVVPA
jgi:hypothetical protein